MRSISSGAGAIQEEEFQGLTLERYIVSIYARRQHVTPKERTVTTYLLESATLTFHDEEVDEEAAENVAASKDVSVLKVDGRDDEGREEGEQEVPQPVAGS